MLARRHFIFRAHNHPAVSSAIRNRRFSVHSIQTRWCPRVSELIRAAELISGYSVLVGMEPSACEACSEPGDVRGQLFCTNCDKHYHAECLMLESNRVVRTGWRCPDCKTCQTCRQSGDDAEMIMCNVCDKGYHTFCLRNQSIPKDGWSCSSCLSLVIKDASSKSFCSLCQNEILPKQSLRQCHLCQTRIHSACYSITDDYYDDDSAYICRSCSISSSTMTLPVDEIDDDNEQQQHKEIYRSSSNSKMQRFMSKSQKSSVSIYLVFRISSASL